MQSFLPYNQRLASPNSTVTAMTPPPTPFHLLRIHASPLTSLSFSPTNTILYSADQTGHISILDLRTRRLVCYWQAHGDGVLGVEEWEGRLIRSVY